MELHGHGNACHSMAVLVRRGCWWNKPPCIQDIPGMPGRSVVHQASVLLKVGLCHPGIHRAVMIDAGHISDNTNSGQFSFYLLRLFGDSHTSISIRAFGTMFGSLVDSMGSVMHDIRWFLQSLCLTLISFTLAFWIVLGSDEVILTKNSSMAKEFGNKLLSCNFS